MSTDARNPVDDLLYDAHESVPDACEAAVLRYLQAHPEVLVRAISSDPERVIEARVLSRWMGDSNSVERYALESMAPAVTVSRHWSQRGQWHWRNEMNVSSWSELFGSREAAMAAADVSLRSLGYALCPQTESELTSQQCASCDGHGIYAESGGQCHDCRGTGRAS